MQINVPLHLESTHLVGYRCMTCAFSPVILYAVTCLNLSTCSGSLYSVLVGLWLVCALGESLPLMHAGDFECRLLLFKSAF
jgi:hypothetical protein